MILSAPRGRSIALAGENRGEFPTRGLIDKGEIRPEEEVRRGRPPSPGSTDEKILILAETVYNKYPLMENNKIVLAASGIMLVFLSGLILRLAKPVFFPFFLAIFFYFILSPALDLLIRCKFPKPLAVFLIVLVSFFVLYLLGVLFYSSGKGFAASFPDYAQKMNTLLNSILEKFHLAKTNWDPWAWSKSIDGSKAAALIVNTMNEIFSFFSTFILFFVFLIFMLTGRGKLKAKVEKSFNPARASKVNEILDNIDGQVQKYLIIKTAISLLSGFLTMVVLLIFGVRYAVVFGFLTFILNFIPSLGSIMAIGISALIAAFQFGSLFPAIWIFIVLVSLDLFTGNFLEPKLMGHGLGLSPLAVLFALFFWGWLWGIPGMILAVPIMAIIKIICGTVPSLRFVAEIMSK